MMRLGGESFNYYEDEGFQYIELPYNGEDVSMIILLPKGIQLGCELEDIDCEPQLGGYVYDFNIPSADSLAQLKSKMSERRIPVYLPKFKLNTKYSMFDDLKEMGIKEAFFDNADFSKMDPSKLLLIDDVKQNAFVEVNEEGTEATATIIIGTITTAAYIPANEFRVYHPFAFYILDNSTGEILFIGRIVDPTVESN